MVETAIVQSIDGEIIKMGCGDVEGCTTCSSSFCSAEKRVYEAVNPKDFDIGEGDLVDVYLSPGKTVAAGFLVLIVPLLLFMAGYLISGKLITTATEGIRAIFGLLGLSTGFALSFTYSKKRKTASMPAIVSVRQKKVTPANGVS
jgi:positive regulator of sigma E activity